MSESSAHTTVQQLLTMTAGWTDYNPEPAKPKLVRRILTTGPTATLAHSSTPTLDPTCSPQYWSMPPGCRRLPMRA